MHEAQEMVARRDSGEIMLFQIKLYENENLELPSFLGNLQYPRLYDYKNVDELSKKIVEAVIEKEKSS
jgi:hypothetical protein